MTLSDRHTSSFAAVPISTSSSRVSVSVFALCASCRPRSVTLFRIADAGSAAVCSDCAMGILAIHRRVFILFAPPLFGTELPLKVGDRLGEVIDLTSRRDAEQFAVIIANLSLRALERSAGTQELQLSRQEFRRAVCLEEMLVRDVDPHRNKLRPRLDWLFFRGFTQLARKLLRSLGISIELVGALLHRPSPQVVPRTVGPHCLYSPIQRAIHAGSLSSAEVWPSLHPSSSDPWLSPWHRAPP